MKKHKMFDPVYAMKTILPFFVGYILVTGYLMWVHQLFFALLVSVVSAAFMLYQFRYSWKWIVVHEDGLEIYAARQTSYIPWELVTSVKNSDTGLVIVVGTDNHPILWEVSHQFSDFVGLRYKLAQACSRLDILFR